MSIVNETLVVLLNGLQNGAIYVLLAVGLSIILGTLKFVNFAHGALYLIGVYVGLLVALETQLTGGKLPEWGYQTIGLDMGFLAALVVVPIFVFVVGLVFERVVAQPFYDRPDTDQILVTFGLAIVVQEVFHVLFGSQSIDFAQPDWASGPVGLPVIGTYPKWRLAIIVITAALVAMVYLLIEYTDFGLVVKAGTLDSEMVELLGIRLSRPYLLVFGVGAALAGVAGVVGGPVEVVNPDVGMTILVPAFLVVVIGGVGSIAGAVLGGIIFGLTESILISVAPAWSQIGIYVLAAIILLVRPQGLLGSEEVAP
ncbi:branched-chain amino acid ABC transporter permease [Halobacteriales archaeon Cl-PHB]